MRAPSTPLLGTAVIVGASVAGLAAARALAGTCERIIVVDRDDLSSSGPRKGVPQARHPHALSILGANVLEGLFPGIGAELVRRGGVRLSPGEDFSFAYGSRRFRHFRSDLAMPVQSRALLEAALRDRVKALSHVELRDRTEVRGLALADGAVRGVRLSSKRGEVELETSLVIDASGRGAPNWWTSTGLTQPDRSEVVIDVGYTSREYRRIGDTLPRGGKSLVVLPLAPAKRMGGIMLLEGERWLVMLGGSLGEHAPTDDAGFKEFSRALPVDDVYTVISTCEPLGPARVCKFPSNLWRHYERWNQRPSGFLAIGDAFAAFNPIYGQGMTAALCSVSILHDLATRAARASSLAGIEAKYFHRAAKVVRTYWDMAVSEDLRYAEVEARRPFGLSFKHWYGTRVLTLCTQHASMAELFVKVTSGLASPGNLFRPSVMMKVLLGPRV